MLAFLYEEDSVLPRTESEFYRDFTLSTLVRCIQKSVGGMDPPPMLTSFDKLPCEERIHFDKICKFAFMATVHSRQVFERSELLDKAGLGLLIIDCYFAKFGFNETYTFVHLSFQEYLTAIFIAGLREAEQKAIVTTLRSQSHFSVTWHFLFGILDYSKESTVDLFKLILDGTYDDHLLHIQCAYESQHCSASACTDVLRFHNYNLEFVNISSYDLTCIIYILKTAEYTTIKLTFSVCDFSTDEVVALLKGIGDHQLSLTVM